MTKTVLAFAASNSKLSINKQLVRYTSSLVKNADIELIDLNDYELPLFSEDREAALGQAPDAAKAFVDKIAGADAIIISFAEHNGSYTAAYKNLFDWASRIDMKVYQDKPMLLLATSPGPGGAQTVLAAAKGSMPYFGGHVLADVSVPSFYEVFDVEAGQLNNSDAAQTSNAHIQAAISSLQTQLEEQVA